MKHDPSLMYTCSLIEFIGRRTRRKRGEVVESLGDEIVTRIYRHASVLHCDSIERVADEFVSLAGNVRQRDYMPL